MRGSTTALTALALVAVLLAASLPGSAALIPPPPTRSDLPALPGPGLPPVQPPPPPAGVGRCLAALQGGANAGLGAASRGRDLGLVALEHQRAVMARFIADASDAAISEEDWVTGFYTGLIEGSGAVVAPAAFLPAWLTTNIGPALGTTVNGTAQASIAVLGIPGQQALVLVSPWAGERVEGVFDPIVAWNQHTTLSRLLQVERQAAFFAGYAAGQGAALTAPPLGTTEEGLGEARDGADLAASGAALLAAGASAATDGMTVGTLDLAALAAPAVVAATTQATLGVAAIQAGSGGASYHARQDGSALAEGLQAAVPGIVGAAGTLPGLASGCSGPS